jgi:antitoxin (DNA-binding transcriptional repressor) of toxin-antitoxin stability system
MTIVTMLEFRKNAGHILRRVGKGERFVLSHRGRAAARLEPITEGTNHQTQADLFLTIGNRAVPSPKGKTSHSEIDALIYGRE